MTADPSELERLIENPPPPDDRADAEDLVLFRREWSARIDLLTQLRQQRNTYAKAAYAIMALWLLYVATVILMTGLGWLSLHETALTALVAGSTVNVLGLAGAVMFSLFPKNGIDVPERSAEHMRWPPMGASGAG